MSGPGERRVPIPDRDPLTWVGDGNPLDLSASGPLVRGAAIFYTLMGTVGAVWMHVAAGPEVWSTRLLGPRPELSAALGIAGGLLLVAVTRALENWQPIARLQKGFAEVLRGVTPGGALLLALVSAVGEEILFRGALQPWVGPWIASAIFGAAHLPLDRNFVAWPVFAFVAGLGLAYCAESSGSLLAPILAHFLVNWINLRHTGRPAGSGSFSR